MKTPFLIAGSVLATVFLSGCGPVVEQAKANTSTALDYLTSGEVYNAESVIPPQCYTRTAQVNNPCYVCHQSYQQDTRPNMMADGSLQGNYEFSDLGMQNHWKNLFIDRRSMIADISDTAIDAYVNEDNYSSWVAELKASDFSGDIPELTHLAHPDNAFGAYGVAKDKSHWVAFNYKPFPSTFWPTNGSTGDVMLRLPKAFREIEGKYSFDAYFANLTLVEMAIKDAQGLSVPPVSEVALNRDLNSDGILSDTITYMRRQSHYVGDAHSTPLAHMLYPQGTEILHTVRYIGVGENGEIYNAPRMKEVRYMRKHMFKSQSELKSAYYIEAKEKAFERLPKTIYHGDKGIANGFGWTINAFIEDEKGRLRQQDRQELAFCNGCHKTLGTTIDQTFSFARKLPGAKGWGYIDLHQIADVANRGAEAGEFLTYLTRVGGGDEFRQNQEMLSRWFDEEGIVRADKVKALPSIQPLITPSPERARALNKAYQTIVKEQSFIFGRDATLGEAINVFERVDPEVAPLDLDHRYQWDLRLDWGQQ